MEEEIDGLDLEGNFTGEKETVDETPKGTEEKEPEKQKKPEPDAGKPEEPKGAEDKANDVPEKKEPEQKGSDQFGVKGHTPKGVQERINALSRSNRELKEQNARILAELESFRKGLPQPKEKTRDDFATDEEWIDYRAERKAREMVESMRTKEREESEMREAETSFRKSEEDARKRLDDYDDVMSMDVNLPVDRDTYLYVNRSPMGAMVLYTLKKVDAVRNQFLMTPEAGKLAFVKQVEERIRQISEQSAQQKQQQPPQTTAVPPAQAAPPPAQPKAALKAPMETRHGVARGLDPATCSMDEWMENGD
jgi:hypothetical protein